MWHVGCQWGIIAWDSRINSNYIYQWDHPGPNNPIEKTLEGFSPFDNWQSHGDFGHIRVILILPFFECFPLDLKITHYLILLNVCCSEVPSHSLIISDKVTCHSHPLLRLGSICECCWGWYTATETCPKLVFFTLKK